MENKTEIKLNNEEEKRIEKAEGLRAPVVFEIIQREGLEELSRPALSLFVSGIIAGLAIGFSVITEAIFHAYLPDTEWRHLVESLGYTVGFVIIIFAGLQLFTENTITPVLPLLLNPKRTVFSKVVRLWSVVLSANVVGTFLFAAMIYYAQPVPKEVYEASLSISRHMMEIEVDQMFIRGIFSGWLIAALVWMLPSAEHSKLWIIILMTYIIAAGSFTHIVAGSVEAFLLVLASELSLLSMIMDFFLPVLLGNIAGGTLLFSMLSYGQIAKEV